MIRLTKSPSVALLGEQAPPRVNVSPPPTRANSWEDVSDLSRSFGITLDPWQDLVLQSAMGERSDGTWAAKQVGLSVPRQNGKSQLIVARALAGALLFGEMKIVISAHQQDTARETFNKFLEMREMSPQLQERIDDRDIMRALNREAIRFKNGALIQFKARSVSGGRGFSSDCLLLDEAQILGMPAWVSINSTMSARPNPQVWLLGTPPTPEDNGEVFTSIRNSALSGRSSTLAWLEWGANRSDDPAKVSTRANANPAWHTRINHEIVQGEYDTYPPERFALDRLGIWLDELQRNAVFGLGKWEACASPGVTPERVSAIGLAVSYDRDHAAIGATDGSAIGVAAYESGVGWIVPEAKRLQDKHRCAVVIAGTGPASDLIPALEAAGVSLTIARGNDSADAVARLFDAVREGPDAVVHPDHPELNAAVEGAHKRLRDDRWVWDRRNSSADVAPLEAVTLAYWGSDSSPNYDVLDSIY